MEGAMKRKGQSGDTGNNRHTRRNTKNPQTTQ
jgi:hypothetical protein